MKHIQLTSRALLGLTLMSALAVAPTLTTVARADAPVANPRADREDRDFDREDTYRRDDSEGRDRGDRRDDERGRTGFGRRDARGSGPRGDRAKGGPGRGGPGRGGPAGLEGRDNERGRADFGRRGPNRDENTTGRTRFGRPDDELTIVPQFTGVVSKVKNDREFDVRIENKTYNVYLTGAANAVRVGQTVGLNGQRIGNNDIRSATLLQARRR